MAGTDQYGQPTWTDADAVNLAVDLTTAADSISSGQYRRGTQAQREAAKPFEGLEWWQTDAGSGKFRYHAGQWQRADHEIGEYRHAHGDWRETHSRITKLPAGEVLFTLKLVGNRSVKWGPQRRQLGSIPAELAPPANIAVMATLRTGGRWEAHAVEVTTNGQVVLDNSSDVQVDGTAQLNLTMNW